METTTILFVTREPVTRERNGSTAAVNNLLALLRAHGAAVTVLVTTGASRSPRLVFRELFALPAGCVLQVPGYVRMGGWYLRLMDPRAWVRAGLRVLGRVPRLDVLRRGVERLSGGRVYGNTWDLTEPTARERALVLGTVGAVQPETVVTNYAFWGPVLREVMGVHRAIVMHDVLSDHVRLFEESGLPLDCPEILPEVEWGWLDAADTVIAIQQAEAEAVRPHVRGAVVVQPIALAARVAAGAPEQGRCLFVGSNSLPNLQGLTWLLQEVWPQVLAKMPDATLAVAGTVRDRWTGALPAGVELLGSVASLEAEYARAAMCLVPLRVGSGLKIKLLEALSHGKAAVSTRVGVQGLEGWVEGVVAVADDADAFADAMVALLRDDGVRRLREEGATGLVRARFGVGSAEEQALLGRLFVERRLA